MILLQQQQQQQQQLQQQQQQQEQSRLLALAGQNALGGGSGHALGGFAAQGSFELPFGPQYVNERPSSRPGGNWEQQVQTAGVACSFQIQ